MLITLLFIAAYLLGSLPWSVWIGRWFYGIDPREYGSGNAGATNCFRVLGSKAGTAVLLLDAAKGFTAVQMGKYWGLPQSLLLVMGALSVLGHLYPLFAQFKGGKGIATLLGIIIALHSGAALLAMAVFLLVFFSSRIVSLSSMAAAISLPIWLIYRFHEASKILIIFTFAIALTVVLTHRRNIRRMLNGEESKIRLPKRKTRHDSN